MAKLTAWETETITAALRSYKYVKDWKGRELVKDQAAMDQIDDLATKLEGARYVKLQLWYPAIGGPMPPKPDMTDPINWPAPAPNFEVGLNYYRCECPVCGRFANWSNRAMLNPERAYRRHYWLRHAIVADVA